MNILFGLRKHTDLRTKSLTKLVDISSLVHRHLTVTVYGFISTSRYSTPPLTYTLAQRRPCNIISTILPRAALSVTKRERFREATFPSEPMSLYVPCLLEWSVSLFVKRYEQIRAVSLAPFEAKSLKFYLISSPFAHKIRFGIRS